ncbi:uncharacterized protein LOC110278238 [Arachis duranensis]|uniref:Uncharacterized protein LOC110278238 n=1 Tax=Arachis duranensis TaxID=130453 RepID=A0A6P5N5Q1_ARADU|nr:uncharacterized protein LOC110278238 [Arachis duranensis]
MSVLINRSPMKSFRMERGLRQGDHLSPFLFILVIDVLHKIIGEVIRNGRISPLLVGRDNIKLSHLQFVDDIMLFCPLKRKLCETIGDWEHRMCGVLRCKATVLSVKYLGINLGVNSRLVKTWKPVIDKNVTLLVTPFW